MKVLAAISLFFLIAADSPAQRRGGGAVGGHVGGGRAGGRIGGGYIGGAGRIGYGGRVGVGHIGYGGHVRYGSVWRGGWGYGYAGWPSWGWGVGFSYWPGYYDWGWSYPTYAAYPAYQPSVQVVYPPPAPAPAVTTVYVERARPVVREYDEFGQERQPAFDATSTQSPLYLLAFRDGVIRAAVAYWVEGTTLHYVTTTKGQKTVPLTDIDRDLSLRLNRERRVSFSLP